MILPSCGFALCYSVTTAATVLAIRYGSLAKTSLIGAFSLLVPTFYGLIVLKEPISVFFIIGIVCSLLSIFLVNYSKSDDEGKITLRWVIAVTLVFFAGGMCSVTQRAKQVVYGEAGNNLFMVVALAIVTVFMTVLAFCVPAERKEIKDAVKKGWYWAFFCGAANGTVNFLVIQLNPKLPASVLFPVISGSGMVLIFLYSVFVRHEKFSLRQTVGFFIGVVSLVFLNLN